MSDSNRMNMRTDSMEYAQHSDSWLAYRFAGGTTVGACIGERTGAAEGDSVGGMSMEQRTHSPTKPRTAGTMPKNAIFIVPPAGEQDGGGYTQKPTYEQLWSLPAGAPFPRRWGVEAIGLCGSALQFNVTQRGVDRSKSAHMHKIAYN